MTVTQNQPSHALPPCAQASGLRSIAHVQHGFFGRRGGVSEGLYGSLNCGSGSNDARENVIENRARIAEALTIAPESLLSVYQIHSPNVVEVSEPWELGQGPQGDAMVTATPGLGLGILTADCGPVLFADCEARVIGAAHAGWKGAIGGVLEATIAAMEKLGAQRARIAAALGPTISQRNYEVGPEFRDRFMEDIEDTARFFRRSARAEHWLFDLPGYIAMRLEDCRVGQVEDLGLCTYADEAAYFSYRRATHAKEADYGRNLSAIALDATAP